MEEIAEDKMFVPEDIRELTEEEKQKYKERADKQWKALMESGFEMPIILGSANCFPPVLNWFSYDNK